MVMLGGSVHLTTLFFLDKFDKAVNQYFMHIISLVTDNSLQSDTYLHNKVYKKGNKIHVLKLRPVVACHKILDKQSRPRSDYFCRSSLIKDFPVCFSVKHFVSFSPDNQHFFEN